MRLAVHGRLGRDVRQIEIMVEHLLSATSVRPQLLEDGAPEPGSANDFDGATGSRDHKDSIPLFTYNSHNGTI